MRKKEAMSNERLKCYRDLKNSLDKAEREARLDEKIETIRASIESNLPIETIAMITRLSIEEVQRIKKELSL
jgi:hypothetical protein